MSRRMYVTSRRIAVVAVALLVAVLLTMKPTARHGLLSRVASLAGAQEGRVTGRVLDATEQNGIATAQVIVTGTTTGTNTADDGTFTLRVPAEARSLTVRRIGYAPQTVTIAAGQADYTISLSKDVLRLETQVVTGGAMTDVSQQFTASKALGFGRSRGFAAGAPAGPIALESAAGVNGEGLPVSDLAMGSVADASRMIVRSGGASIEVASIDSAIPRVRALASAIGGFVANSAIQAGRDQVRAATLEVKAPADGFDRLITNLGPLGKIEYVNVTAQDVGEEYVDVEARMANDHRLEERLIELLATRTGKLKDVLDVEQELARVREEIERYEGRLRFLRSHAELSTLTITVHEPTPIIDHVAPNPIAAAARQAWHNFIGLVAFVIASMGVLLPVAVVGGGLWWMLRPAKAATRPQAV